MQVIMTVDPFTYSVHAFKCLLLKNTGMAPFCGLRRTVPLSAVAMTLATRLPADAVTTGGGHRGTRRASG
jgi:hypothetical protein